MAEKDKRDLRQELADCLIEQIEQGTARWQKPWQAGEADTRKGGGYPHEYSDEDHRTLLERLKQSSGHVAISGYAHPLYAALLEADGWECKDIAWHCNTVLNTTGRENPNLEAERTESVWLNPRLVSWHREKVDRQQLIFMFHDLDQVVA